MGWMGRCLRREQLGHQRVHQPITDGGHAFLLGDQLSGQSWPRFRANRAFRPSHRPYRSPKVRLEYQQATVLILRTLSTQLQISSRGFVQSLVPP